MNILIIRLSAIGDVVHVLPSINLLRYYFKNDNISWVVTKKASDILYNCNLLDTVYTLSDSFPKSLYHDYPKIKELQNINWDIIIDYHNIFKSLFLRLFLYGPVYTFSYNNFNNIEEKISCLLSNYNSEYFIPKNKVEKNIKLSEFIIKKYKTHNIKNIDIKSFKINSLSKKGESWLNSNKIVDFIIICVNSSRIQKNWKLDNWIDLINLLIDKKENIVLLGSDFSEIGKKLKVILMNNKRVYIAPKFTLSNSCYLLEKTKLLIALDSSILHLANYINGNTLGLFGPTSAIYYNSTNYYPKSNYIQSKTSKNFINHRNYRDANCINDILPQDVFIKIQEVLFKQKK
jgi:heptosyltransferase I